MAGPDPDHPGFSKVRSGAEEYSVRGDDIRQERPLEVTTVIASRSTGCTTTASGSGGGRAVRGREVSLLLGGDLNGPAVRFLLRHYGETPTGPSSATVEKAQERFRSHVMKSCHHGSSDVTDEFLQAVHPFAFVVCSGGQTHWFRHDPSTGFVPITSAAAATEP